MPKSESEFEFVADLPEPSLHRDVAKYAHAAKADPEGRWILVPYPAKEDLHGCVVQNLKRQHHVEARTVNGVIYCRRRPDKAPTK